MALCHKRFGRPCSRRKNSGLNSSSKTGTRGPLYVATYKQKLFDLFSRGGRDAELECLVRYQTDVSSKFLRYEYIRGLEL